jgi:galactokinase
MPTFTEVFGQAPSVVAAAPGRVNMLGEHTDYNDGFVLPIAIPQQTRVALRPLSHAALAAASPTVTVHAEMLDETARFDLHKAPTEHFATYVYGCLREVQALGYAIPSLDIHISSNVPMGVGLSSSAALEVAMLRALRQLLQVAFDDVQIAAMAQRAEIVYAGVRCGIMDQMASSLADTTHALFLDTRTLHRRLVPLPVGTEVLVLDSGVTRSLAASGYNTRRAECELAARQLGLGSLRELTDTPAGPTALDTLSESLRRRVRHVVSENQRVLRAVQGIEAKEFGVLMNASHSSLRDDYEVSVPPLDQLVALLQSQPGVYGARLTGAGFGGACVALCALDAGREIGRLVLQKFNRSGAGGRILVPPPPEDSALGALA